VPGYIDTGTVIINKDNAKYFYHKEDPFDYSGWKLPLRTLKKPTYGLALYRDTIFY